MQLLFLGLALVGSTFADFRFNPRLSAREQDGPYQPTGWRPSGPPLSLPLRQQLPLEFTPSQAYGPPSREYGPPPTTTEQEVTTTEVPATTTEQQVEQIKEQQKEVKENKEKLAEDSAVSKQGIYYIYHPTGLLQRVIYMTKEDLQNMAYSAQVKYENVEPIKEPIYTYDPNTLVLKQIQI